MNKWENISVKISGEQIPVGKIKSIKYVDGKKVESYLSIEEFEAEQKLINEGYMAKIIKSYVEAEDNVIKEVLRQILKREPTLEDAKDLCKFQQEGEFDKYVLAYKNRKLGTVYINSNFEGGKMGIKFVPFGMNDFLEPATNLDGTKVMF